MLIDIEELVAKHQLDVNGVLHVGAHHGEEADVYDNLGVQVDWIEADYDAYKILTFELAARPNQKATYALVADVEGKKHQFHVTNNGQSSSILKFGTHAKEHPEVEVVRTVKKTATTVDALFRDGEIDQHNFMNLDVQGAELLVLQGSQKYLESVEFVYSEVNKKELYKDCVQIKELGLWLKKQGFSKRLDLKWTKHGWGDAVWAR